MKRAALAILFLLALSAAVQAGNMFFFNVGNNGGSLGACGSGVIDLSTGCIIGVLP